jgi:hypothetical protein
MSGAPNATSISVEEVLKKFDADFAAMANAVDNGEFALWVGSGISRKAPNLGDLIARAMEYLRVRAIDPDTQAVFEPPLIDALKLARIEPDQARQYFAVPFVNWPISEAIKGELWNKYSRLLDIRIKGEPADYMLWDVVDIREAFARPGPPAAQHLCIAILILEGAIHEVASANWDGYIETAVKRLGKGVPALLQVIVDPVHLREAAGKARLLKFHGCIVYATKEPAIFRRYLTGSKTQITEWPDKPEFAAMRAAITALATNLKSLVLGLSIQDANLQAVFSAAKHMHPWPWPCAPAAPGHIFCEDEIGEGQRDVLKIVYGDRYNDNVDEIEAGSHLRAWAEQVLIALVLKLITAKLVKLINLRLGGTRLAGACADVIESLTGLRDAIAQLAVGDRTDFTNRAIATWSRLVSIFRTGTLPRDDSYEVLSASTPNQLGADQNAQAAKLGNLGIALSLLQFGRSGGLWELDMPATVEAVSGAITAKAEWAGSRGRPIFLVRGAGEAIALQKIGAFANGDSIVIHADGVWPLMLETGLGSARRPRSPPGRSGRVKTRHVSIDRLIETCVDAIELRTTFVAEVTL